MAAQPSLPLEGKVSKPTALTDEVTNNNLYTYLNINIYLLYHDISIYSNDISTFTHIIEKSCDKEDIK